LENEPDRSNAQVNPVHWRVAAVVAGANLPAIRASRSAPRRRYREDEATFIEIDAGDEKTGNPDQYSGKLGDAHGLYPRFQDVVDTRKPENHARFNYFFLDIRKLRRAADHSAKKSGALPTLDAGEPLFRRNSSPPLKLSTIRAC
jgi:hypothetical protein